MRRLFSRRRFSPSEGARQEDYPGVHFHLAGLPVQARGQDPHVTEDYLAQYWSFETFWATKNEDDITDPFPRDLVQVMDAWPDALQFYRHSLYAYLDRTLGLNPWVSTIRSLWSRLARLDPDGNEAFFQRAWESHGDHAPQRDNALSFSFSVDLSDPDPKEVRDALAAYQSAYEIDLPIWFLGVMGKAYREGCFSPDAFGGPATSTQQKALADQVLASLEGTPLVEPFSLAYDADLRNAVGHNSYRLDLNEGVIVDTRIGMKWSIEDALLRLNATLRLLLAVEHAIQYFGFVWKPSRQGEFRDQGVTDLRFGLLDDGRPIVIALQLWCFRDIDPSGDWLDEAELRIEPAADGLERVSLTSSGHLEGVEMSSTDWGDALREWGWALVRRVPVAPYIGTGYPIFERPDDVILEVVGDTDEHLVKFLRSS